MDSLSTVTSPDLHNEKKVVVEAAHSITLVKEGASLSHTLFSLCRIDGVIGRWGLGDLPILPSWTSVLILASGQPEDLAGPWLSGSDGLLTDKS